MFIEERIKQWLSSFFSSYLSEFHSFKKVSKVLLYTIIKALTQTFIPDFGLKITFVNSQHAHTNSEGFFTKKT